MYYYYFAMLYDSCIDMKKKKKNVCDLHVYRTNFSIT